MGVEVKQGKRGESIVAPQFVATSEIGPTTYGEGQAVVQEKWEDYQPEIAEEKAARADRDASDAPDVVVRADGGRPFAADLPKGRKVGSEGEKSRLNVEPAEGEDAADVKSRKAKGK